MTDAIATALCAALPGAAMSEPFGPGIFVWKVGDKIFASVSDAGTVVKTPGIDAAEMLIAAGLAHKAPYFHRSWVQFPPGAAEDELRHRVHASYRLIRATLTKKAQATLAPF